MQRKDSFRFDIIDLVPLNLFGLSFRRLFSFPLSLINSVINLIIFLNKTAREKSFNFWI